MTSEGDQIMLQIRARYPVILVRSWEEERVLLELRSKVAKVGVWSCTKGLIMGNRKIDDTAEPGQVMAHILGPDSEQGVYVLLDFHKFVGDPVIERLLRDAVRELPPQKKSIVIVSPDMAIPAGLSKEIVADDYGLPTESEIGQILDEIIEKAGKDKNGKQIVPFPVNGEREAIIKACMGLTRMEIENALAKTVVEFHRFNIDSIIKEKQQVIKKSGVLEYWDAVEDLSNVGGLDEVKEFLQDRRGLFTNKATERGIPAPKGVLLVGVPGCGKSLCAKMIPSMWKMPLLKYDASKIMAIHVGESEQNMARMTKIAEAVAPCVLWIDEIEKMMAGVESSGSSDAGTKAGVFGILISWLQDKKLPVFVVATANDIKSLESAGSALCRKGRFDEIFYVDLPNKVERAEITRIHIRKNKRDPTEFDIPAIVEVTNQFSGSEIEEAIRAANIKAFNGGSDKSRPFTTEDIVNAATRTVPIAVTMKEDIARSRKWAETRARPASKKDDEEQKEKGRNLDM